MSEFLTLVQSNGITGLFVGLLVLLTVYALNAGNVIVTGGQKRSANVILSILLAGVSLLNPESADVVVASIASISSALIYEFVNYLLAKRQAQKAG